MVDLFFYPLPSGTQLQESKLGQILHKSRAPLRWSHSISRSMSSLLIRRGDNQYVKSIKESFIQKKTKLYRLHLKKTCDLCSDCISRKLATFLLFFVAKIHILLIYVFPCPWPWPWPWPRYSSRQTIVDRYQNNDRDRGRDRDHVTLLDKLLLIDTKTMTVTVAVTVTMTVTVTVTMKMTVTVTVTTLLFSTNYCW